MGAHEAIAECVADSLTTFRRLLLSRHTATRRDKTELAGCYDKSYIIAAEKSREDVNDHRSCRHNLNSCETKA